VGALDARPTTCLVARSGARRSYLDDRGSRRTVARRALRGSSPGPRRPGRWCRQRRQRGQRGRRAGRARGRGERGEGTVPGDISRNPYR
jgi:hypothetical protein